VMCLHSVQSHFPSHLSHPPAFSPPSSHQQAVVRHKKENAASSSGSASTGGGGSSRATTKRLSRCSHQHEMECVQCCLPGNLCDYPFHRHFLDEMHFLGVRVKEPYELYCDVCGDFQYSAEFDKVCLYHPYMEGIG